MKYTRHPSNCYKPHNDLEDLSSVISEMLADPGERTTDQLRKAAWLCKRAKRGFHGYAKKATA